MADAERGSNATNDAVATFDGQPPRGKAVSAEWWHRVGKAARRMANALLAMGLLTGVVVGTALVVYRGQIDPSLVDRQPVVSLVAFVILAVLNGVLLLAMTQLSLVYPQQGSDAPRIRRLLWWSRVRLDWLVLINVLLLVALLGLIPAFEFGWLPLSVVERLLGTTHEHFGWYFANQLISYGVPVMLLHIAALIHIQQLLGLAGRRRSQRWAGRLAWLARGLTLALLVSFFVFWVGMHRVILPGMEAVVEPLVVQDIFGIDLGLEDWTLRPEVELYSTSVAVVMFAASLVGWPLVLVGEWALCRQLANVQPTRAADGSQ